LSKEKRLSPMKRKKQMRGWKGGKRKGFKKKNQRKVTKGKKNRGGKKKGIKVVSEHSDYQKSDKEKKKGKNKNPIKNWKGYAQSKRGNVLNQSNKRRST